RTSQRSRPVVARGRRARCGCSQGQGILDDHFQSTRQTETWRRQMNQHATQGAYGELIEPTSLKIERRLPGPIERVWAYITDGELRRKWLAAGQMETRVGATVEMVWRNDELTDPPGHRPAGYAVEHRMPCKILEIDPPRHIVFTFGTNGDVSIDL